MKPKKSDHIVTQLFLQQWRKGSPEQSTFLLTPQECARKFRNHTIKDIAYAMLLIAAFIFVCAIVLNEFWLKGSGFISFGFGFGTVLMVGLFQLYKPGKLGPLTRKMHFDWQELSRGLRRQNLLYHDDLVNESDFAYLIKCRFQDLVEEIKTAEHREDSVLKTKLKARLSNLCNLCQKLNLQLTNYDDLFDGQIEVRWRNAPRGNTVVILPPKPVPAR